MREEIYKENILDHYKNPHNFGRLDKPSVKHRELNPVCGDDIEIFVKFDKFDKIEDVKFEGKGCAISQASISILTDFIKGKTKKQIKELKREDVLKLLGIRVGISRLKCALLSLKTLQKGVEEYEKIRN